MGCGPLAPRWNLFHTENSPDRLQCRPSPLLLHRNPWQALRWRHPPLHFLGLLRRSNLFCDLMGPCRHGYETIRNSCMDDRLGNNARHNVSAEYAPLGVPHFWGVLGLSDVLCVPVQRDQAEVYWGVLVLSEAHVTVWIGGAGFHILSDEVHWVVDMVESGLCAVVWNPLHFDKLWLLHRPSNDYLYNLAVDQLAWHRYYRFLCLHVLESFDLVHVCRIQFS